MEDTSQFPNICTCLRKATKIPHGDKTDTNHDWRVVSGNLPAAMEYLTNNGVVRLLGH